MASAPAGGWFLVYNHGNGIDSCTLNAARRDDRCTTDYFLFLFNDYYRQLRQEAREDERRKKNIYILMDDKSW